MNKEQIEQNKTILYITFWGQLASQSLHAIMIIFLTKPLLENGLNYGEAHAYKFLGISHAMGYLLPLLGGIIADNLLGIRRAILIGAIIISIAYLLVMISGFTIAKYHDYFFIMAYALIPMASSLLMGTASAMISHINAKDAIKAKKAMTYYYMTINIGALIGNIIAPELMESSYGPLSVLALVFIGKSIAALNFYKKYNCYNNVVWGKDRNNVSKQNMLYFILYLFSIYCLTLLAYNFIHIANIIITIGCIGGIAWFFIQTLKLPYKKKIKQSIALFLILEAIVFFIIYNQMNSTLVLFAHKNSDLTLFGFPVRAAHYQLLNPLLIILIGSKLPKLYEKYPSFTIPYQFALGTMLASTALLFISYCAYNAHDGVINGNYIAITYIFITIAELLVSAIGLSMIGLYCDVDNLGLAMGVWYLASSISNTISGHIGQFVSLPKTMINPILSIHIYKQYYLNLGLISLCISFIMIISGIIIQKNAARYKIVII